MRISLTYLGVFILMGLAVFHCVVQKQHSKGVGMGGAALIAAGLRRRIEDVLQIRDDVHQVRDIVTGTKGES